MPRIDIFCDGSVTASTLLDPMTSGTGTEQIARGMVLIPELDYGLIAQTREGITTAAGDPKSDVAEAFAINLALAAAEQLDLKDFRVCSDCEGPVRRANNPRVEWHSREELRLPNDFFEKVLRRAAYLRKTKGRVVRRKIQPHQIEIFDLFNVSRREFRISESNLWSRIVRDAQRYGSDALGLPKQQA